MSYGLYISNGIDGAVITNSNNVFNEEYDFNFSESLSSGSTTTIAIEGAGNPALIGFDLDTSNNNLVVTRDLTNDTLSITNSGNATADYTAKFFRFQ